MTHFVAKSDICDKERPTCTVAEHWMTFTAVAEVGTVFVAARSEHPWRADWGKGGGIIQLVVGVRTGEIIQQ